MSAIASSSLQPALSKSLLAGVIAGVIAAVINNVYGFAYTAVTGNSHPLINPVSITLASLIPLLIAGLGYWLVARFMPARATLIFVAGTLVLAALSLGSSFGGQLPDGSTAPAWFPALSAPMHIVAGLVGAFGVPRLADR